MNEDQSSINRGLINRRFNQSKIQSVEDLINRRFWIFRNNNFFYNKDNEIF